MSNREDDDADRKTNDRPEPRTWRERHGAMLIVAVFAAVSILMAFIEKKMVR